jgi:hypothetical protein
MLAVSDGTNSTTIKGGSLLAGIYVYTLIADDKPVCRFRQYLARRKNKKNVEQKSDYISDM